MAGGKIQKTISRRAKPDGAMSIVDSCPPLAAEPPRHNPCQMRDETFVDAVRDLHGFGSKGKRQPSGHGREHFQYPRGTNHTFKVIGNETLRHLSF